MAIDILGLGISVDTSPLKGLSKAMGDVSKSSTKMADDIDKSSTKTEKLGKSTTTLASQLKGLVGAYAGIAGIGALGRTVDDYTKFTAQLKLATKNQQEFAAAYENSIAIAKSAQADISAVGNTYSRLARSLSDLGASQAQISNVTETVALGLKVSGASATEASNAMLQLSQAFAAGKLSGDEFRSMAENAPILMRILADSIGVPIGQLKQMAADGKLTSEVMANAFKNPAIVASLRVQAGQINTISGAYQNLKNELTIAIGEFDKATGASKAIANVLKSIATNIDSVIKVASGLSIALLALSSREIISGLVELTKNINLVKLTLTLTTIAAVAFYNEFSGKNATEAGRIRILSNEIVKLNEVLASGTKQIRTDKGLENIKLTDAEIQSIIAQRNKLVTEINDIQKKINPPTDADPALTGDNVASAEDIKAAENFIEKLEKQAATFELSKSEALLYEASLLKLTQAQKDHANNLINTISMQEREIAIRKETASYTGDLEAIFSLNKAEEDNLTILQKRLDLMSQLPDALKKKAQAEIDLARVTEEANAATKATNEAMVIDEPQMSADKSFENEYNKIKRQTEDLNTAIISNDKERAKKQLEIEHNRIVEQYALNKDYTEQQIKDLIDAENERYEIAKNNLSSTRDLAKELGMTFTSAFEDAIVAGKQFSDVLKGIAQDIIKIAARKLVTEPLYGQMSNIFSGMFSGFGGFRASGGAVEANTPYVVGEQGAEMFVPSTSGTIIPNNKLNGGNQVNNVSITINDNGTRQEQGSTTQMAKQIEAAVVKVLIDQKRQGGIYA